MRLKLYLLGDGEGGLPKLGDLEKYVLLANFNSVNYSSDLYYFKFVLHKLYYYIPYDI